MTTRPTDVLWDALVEAMGTPAPITRSGRGAWNHALRELREVGATPELIHFAASNYRDRWTDVELTPTALVKHLHLFVDEREPKHLHLFERPFVDVERAPTVVWVDPVDLDKPETVPIVIRYPDGSTGRARRVLIDGPSELVHRPEGYPDGKHVALETFADVELIA